MLNPLPPIGYSISEGKRSSGISAPCLKNFTAPGWYGIVVLSRLSILIPSAISGQTCFILSTLSYTVLRMSYTISSETSLLTKNKLNNPKPSAPFGSALYVPGGISSQA